MKPSRSYLKQQPQPRCWQKALTYRKPGWRHICWAKGLQKAFVRLRWPLCYSMARGARVLTLLLTAARAAFLIQTGKGED